MNLSHKGKCTTSKKVKAHKIRENIGKELTLKIYKELQLNNNDKKATDMNRYFSREDTQITNECRKRSSPLLVIREMQIKTMRYQGGDYHKKE
jgi:hypothetical protein